MRYKRWIALLTVFMLCASMTGAALAESPLMDLWSSGCNLLFHTDNVTVDGEATFSLDGVRFKTAKLHYVQDEFRSLYDLKLFTPRNSGEQETGWTVIGDGKGNIYVMEAYTPGVYRMRHDDDSVHKSLLRPSVGLNAMAYLGGSTVAAVEPMLLEGAVTVSETDKMKTLSLTLSGDQLPAVAQSALNVGFDFLADRWFARGLDWPADNVNYFDHYLSVTTALMGCTQRWRLGGIDADFALDSHGRLTGAEGNMQVMAVLGDDSEREIEVVFSLTITDYNASAVMRFDPDEWGVTPEGYIFVEHGRSLLNDRQMDTLQKTVTAILSSQGFSVQEKAEWDVWFSGGVLICTEVRNPNGVKYECAFTGDGTFRLVHMQEKTTAWAFTEMQAVEGVDEETIAAAQDLADSFLKEHQPEIAESLGEWTLRGLYVTEDGRWYLAMDDASNPIKTPIFVLRIAPSLRIEYFDCEGRDGIPIESTQPRG